MQLIKSMQFYVKQLRFIIAEQNNDNYLKYLNNNNFIIISPFFSYNNDADK